jgi:molybdopterin-synthase adenylyltransferase
VKSVRISAPMLSTLRKTILESANESCAILFTHSTACEELEENGIAAALSFPPAGAYIERTPTSASLFPAYIVEVVNRARAGEFGLVFVHSHPFATGIPCFSSVDDYGERGLMNFLRLRLPGVNHLAIVVGPQGLNCRNLGENCPVDVIEVGQQLTIHTGTQTICQSDLTFDRQIRAFGATGQQVIKQLTVGIVGLGGTGSLMAQQLAYLGVKDFILIDPDTVEQHNLNRLVGAGPTDVGAPKVAVAARHLKFINPNARILSLQRDVVDEAVPNSLVCADFVFCCTDSQASRAVLNQLAYQYLVPCIDMGVSIGLGASGVASITGRVQMLAPGLACLTCTNAIDPRGVREEFMTPEQRTMDPYFRGGAGDAQPAVISLNSTVTSLATSMFLGAVTLAPFTTRFQLYDGIVGTVRPVVASAEPRCIVCSPAGALARAGSWQLPTRPPIQSKLQGEDG